MYTRGTGCENRVRARVYKCSQVVVCVEASPLRRGGCKVGGVPHAGTPQICLKICAHTWLVIYASIAIALREVSKIKLVIPW